MYPTPGMQDGTVMVRESWLWVVSQPVSSRLAARVGTGVQPLQGENYTYSRELGHVQLLIQLHFPAWIAAEVRGVGVPAPNQGWVTS